MTEELNSEITQPTNVEKPNNYLVGTIIATVLCCIPVGIAGIVFAAQVNSKYATGDYAGAERASKKAKQFMIWTIVAGLIFYIAYFAFFGSVIMTMINSAQ